MNTLIFSEKLPGVVSEFRVRILPKISGGPDGPPTFQNLGVCHQNWGPKAVCLKKSDNIKGEGTFLYSTVSSPWDCSYIARYPVLGTVLI